MKIEGPPIRVVWSLLWRAVVLTPFAVLYFWLIILAWAGVVLLPIATALFLWRADWLVAAACSLGWVPSFLLIRWAFRRSRADAEVQGVLI